MTFLLVQGLFSGANCGDVKAENPATFIMKNNSWRRNFLFTHHFPFTSLKFNIDTQNVMFERRYIFQTNIFGIHVRFQWCTCFFPLETWVGRVDDSKIQETSSIAREDPSSWSPGEASSGPFGEYPGPIWVSLYLENHPGWKLVSNHLWAI